MIQDRQKKKRDSITDKRAESLEPGSTAVAALLKRNASSLAKAVSTVSNRGARR